MNIQLLAPSLDKELLDRLNLIGVVISSLSASETSRIDSCFQQPTEFNLAGQLLVRQLILLRID